MSKVIRIVTSGEEFSEIPEANRRAQRPARDRALARTADSARAEAALCAESLERGGKAAKGRGKTPPKAEPHDDFSRHWKIVRNGLREQAARLREPMTLEELTHVVLSARADYGTRDGERPLSEAAYFKREGLIDKALDRLERLAAKASKKKDPEDSEPSEEVKVWLRERAVLMEIMEQHPEFLNMFTERMDACEDA